VHKAFLEIARTEGQKSQDKKKALINKLLVAAGQNEAGYIMRCLQVASRGRTLHVSLGNRKPSGFVEYLGGLQHTCLVNQMPLPCAAPCVTD
jgi:hypothetical protein